MKYDAVVEPVVVPIVLLRNVLHGRRKPFRRWVGKFGYVDILGCEPEIARQHQRRAAGYRDLQLRSGLNRCAADPVEGVEQRVAAEGYRHCASLMKTLPPARASSE